MATKIDEKLQDTEQEYDPWKDMVPVFLPKGNPREENFARVGVNGRMFQVPKGRQVQVPRPVYTVLMYSQDAKDFTDRFDGQNESVEREGL